MSVYYCALRGTIHTAALGEIFSHSLGVESSASAQVVATAVHDAWITLWGTAATGIGTMFTSTVTYTEATAAPVLDPMIPDLGAAWHAAFSPALVGRGTGKSLPSQCAVAVSLTAGNRADGRPFKGRFYLPPPDDTTTDVNGMLPQATADNLAVGFKDFFEDLNQAGHYVSVWSRTTDGLVNPVNLVRVGNKIDTIRSRRNAQPEAYGAQAVIGPQ